MEYSSGSKEQVEDYAKRTISVLHKYEFPPIPELYELWYVYYSRQNPLVRQELEDAQKSDSGVTLEGCLEIYHRYLSRGRGEEAVRKAGEQINATIRDMATIVTDVKDAAGDYSDKLGGVQKKIAAVKKPEDLKKLVDGVINDTAGMLEENQKLEKQLDQSTLVMESLQEELETFRREALTDGLTGLLNRKAFDSEVKKILENSYKEGFPFTLLIGDIDHFKTFNDSFGHQVGDQVLRLVAKTLTDGVKGRDIVARYGGEEFVIILPETTLSSGVIVGNALRKAIAAKEVVNRTSGMKIGRITMSLGVAEYKKGEMVEDLIERADAALYTAKHNGRNQVAAAPTIIPA